MSSARRFLASLPVLSAVMSSGRGQPPRDMARVAAGITAGRAGRRVEACVVARLVWTTLHTRVGGGRKRKAGWGGAAAGGWGGRDVRLRVAGAAELVGDGGGGDAVVTSTPPSGDGVLGIL